MRNYEGELTIEGVDLWELVIKNFLPDSGDAVVFGNPVWDAEGQALHIKYAGSNECDPRSWHKKPEFLTD